ncbi:MAG: OmpH family outer membrane protein [Draconibacterium sp.]
MKIRFLLVFPIILLTVSVLQAQTALKVAHVNVQELVQTHPLLDSIQGVLDQEAKDMEQIYADMLEEQQTKMDVFEKENAGYSELMKKTKQEELLALAQKIQNYNQTAQQTLRQRNMELIQPVYQNVSAAINEVAKENKITYVLDVSTGAVAYMAPDTQDITELVRQKFQK